MDREFMEFLGAKLRDIRKCMGLTQEQLAGTLGTHAVVISKRERGMHKDIGCVTLVEHCEALDVETGRFLDETREEYDVLLGQEGKS